MKTVRLKLTYLMTLCLDKSLTLHLSPLNNNINVYAFNEDGTPKFSYNSWYEGELKGLESLKSIKIDDLIKKVEDYVV